MVQAILQACGQLLPSKTKVPEIKYSDFSVPLPIPIPHSPVAADLGNALDFRSNGNAAASIFFIISCSVLQLARHGPRWDSLIGDLEDTTRPEVPSVPPTDEGAVVIHKWITTVRSKSIAVNRFNSIASSSPKKAVAALISAGLVKEDPVEIANYFLDPANLGASSNALNYQAIGHVLGHLYEPGTVLHDILPAYTQLASVRQRWETLGIFGAIQAFTRNFSMMLEAGELDRIMLDFCDSYARVTGYTNQLVNRDEDDDVEAHPSLAQAR